MFADNQRISSLQLQRQFSLVYLAPLLLWTVTGLKGRAGICSVFLGCGILCVWVFFLLRQIHVYRCPEKYWGKIMSKVIGLCFLAYLIFTASWLVAKTGDILTKYLVQGISGWAASGVFVLAALGACQHVQARGRFAQTAWPVAAALLFVMFLMAAFQGETELFMGQSTQPKWSTEEIKDAVRGTGGFLAAFLGVGLIPFLEIQTDKERGQAASIFRTIGKTGLWMSGVILILQAAFGAYGAESLEYPVLDLMAGVRLPGGFLRRIDLIFLTVILFALLFSLGSLFFYSRYIGERVRLPMNRILAAALCFVFGTADVSRKWLIQEYPRILLWIFLPLFLGITVCTALLRRKNHGKALLLSLLLIFLSVLSGCRIVEPEKRAYPLVIGIDRKEGKYQIYLSMAQLAKSTGQGKEGGEEQQGNGDGALLLEGYSGKEIQKIYEETRELYLDPGHVQAVIFGPGLLKDEEQFLHVLGKMEKDSALGSSAYVFTTQNLPQILGENGAQVESLGEFLSGLYENRPTGESPVVLSDIYRALHNRRSFPEIPTVFVSEDQIYVDKTTP